MLPKQHRLHRKSGFGEVIKSGKRLGSPHLVVHYLVGEPEATETPVAGITVAKSQVPKAVDRARLKRQLRHLLSTRLADQPAGSRIVVRGLRGASGKSSEELSVTLDRLLARALRRDDVGAKH